MSVGKASGILPGIDRKRHRSYWLVTPAAGSEFNPSRGTTDRGL